MSQFWIGVEVGHAEDHDRRGVVVDSHPERGWLVWWCMAERAEWHTAGDLWAREEPDDDEEDRIVADHRPLDLAAELRKLDAEGLRKLREDARIADSWRFFDDDGTEISEDEEDWDAAVADLESLAETAAAKVSRGYGPAGRTRDWCWRVYRPDGGHMPDVTAPTLAEAQTAAEVSRG